MNKVDSIFSGSLLLWYRKVLINGNYWITVGVSGCHSRGDSHDTCIQKKKEEKENQGCWGTKKINK